MFNSPLVATISTLLLLRNEDPWYFFAPALLDNSAASRTSKARRADEAGTFDAISLQPWPSMGVGGTIAPPREPWP